MSPTQLLLLLAPASKSLPACRPPPPHLPYDLVVHHGNLEVILQVFLSDFSLHSRSVTGYLPPLVSHHVPWSLQFILTPWPPTFLKALSSLVLPKLTSLPPKGSPRLAEWVQAPTLRTPFLTGCPLLQAPFTLAALFPPPPCLCSFLALMLGNQRGMPHPLPAYLNPPNSSKTSSRPSPPCAAS